MTGMGAWGVSSSPPQNLVAGGCRFGVNPDNSVLDPDCRAHEVDNLYVTDFEDFSLGNLGGQFDWVVVVDAEGQIVDSGDAHADRVVGADHSAGGFRPGDGQTAGVGILLQKRAASLA